MEGQSDPRVGLKESVRVGELSREGTGRTKYRNGAVGATDEGKSER